MNNTILNFINQFHNLEIFSNGMCYWFAHILSHRFNGRIIYDPIDGHFATLINNNIYDATGNITSKPCYWILWNPTDAPEDQRIIRDCIYKLPTDTINCGSCMLYDGTKCSATDEFCYPASFCSLGLQERN